MTNLQSRKEDWDAPVRTRAATNKGADSGQNVPTGEDDDEVLEALQKQIKEQAEMLKLLLANQEAQKAEIRAMKEELRQLKEQLRRLRGYTQDLGGIPIVLFYGNFYQFRPV